MFQVAVPSEYVKCISKLEYVEFRCVQPCVLRTVNCATTNESVKNVRGAMNCATTNAFFVNEIQFIRNGIKSKIIYTQARLGRNQRDQCHWANTRPVFAMIPRLASREV